MQSICLYLAAFAGVEPADRIVRRAACDAIAAVVGVQVDDRAVRVTGRMVYVMAHPLLKTELYIRREEVSTQLNKLLADRRPTNIR